MTVPLPSQGSTNWYAWASDIHDKANAAAAVPSASDITTGTLADARIASTIARDSEVTAAVAAAKALLSINVKDYGAVGNGSTNDTTAIQAALNAVPTNGAGVYFPAGTYLVPNGGLTCANPVRLYGEPGLDGTGSRIHVTADAVTAVTLSGSASVVEGISVTHPASGTRSSTLVGLVVNNANFSRLDGVKVSGFSTNLVVSTGIYYSVLNCSIRDFVAIGLELINPLAGGDAGDSTVHGCSFDRGSDTVTGGDAVVWRSGGGLRFVNNKINGRPTHKFANGVRFLPADGVGTAVLMVANNSIENFTGIGVELAYNANGSIVHTFMVVGNEIAPYDQTASTCVFVNQSVEGVVINGNHFRTATYAMDVQRIKQAAISGNTVSDVTGGGLRVRDLARNVVVSPQPMAIFPPGYAVQFDNPLYAAEARFEQTINFPYLVDTAVHPQFEISLNAYTVVMLDLEITGLNQNSGSFVVRLSRALGATGDSDAVSITTVGTDYFPANSLAVNFDTATTPKKVVVGFQKTAGTELSGQVKVTAWGNGLAQVKPRTNPSIP